MPEGDTIFRAARTLDQAFAGSVVTRFESVLPALNRVHEDHPVTGRTVERVSAAGKHLLMRFSGDLVLRTHMRMSGSWHLYRPGEAWWLPRAEARIVVGTEAFVGVAFQVPVAEFLQGRAIERQRDLAALGPDLLGADFDADAALARLRARDATPIAEVLLDQRALAGIGNVYKSEVLFLARVSPFAPVRSLDDATLLSLTTTARRLLAANVRPDTPGEIVTYSGLRRTTRSSDPSERLWVYGRGGRPCRRCGTPIARVKTGPHARSTWWCPKCQPDTDRDHSLQDG